MADTAPTTTHHVIRPSSPPSTTPAGSPRMSTNPLKRKDRPEDEQDVKPVISPSASTPHTHPSTTAKGSSSSAVTLPTGAHARPDEYEAGRVICETCGAGVSFRDEQTGGFTVGHWEAHRLSCPSSSSPTAAAPLVYAHCSPPPPASSSSDAPLQIPPTKRRRAKRTEEERIEYLRADPYVGQFEAYRVLCASCDKWIRLRPNSTYCSIPWDAHRKSCLAKKVNNKNVYALEERNTLFSKDPDVRKFDPERLLCNMCDHWLSVPADDHLHAVQKWLQHRATCQRTQAPPSPPSPKDKAPASPHNPPPVLPSQPPPSISTPNTPTSNPPPPRLPPLSPSSFHDLTPSTYAPAHESRRRNAEQRAATLRADRLIGQVEPNRVFCTLCQKWVQLRQDSSFCAYPWLQHRGKCLARYQRRAHSQMQGQGQRTGDGMVRRYPPLHPLVHKHVPKYDEMQMQMEEDELMSDQDMDVDMDGDGTTPTKSVLDVESEDGDGDGDEGDEAGKDKQTEKDKEKYSEESKHRKERDAAAAAAADRRRRATMLEERPRSARHPQPHAHPHSHPSEHPHHQPQYSSHPHPHAHGHGHHPSHNKSRSLPYARYPGPGPMITRNGPPHPPPGYRVPVDNRAHHPHPRPPPPLPLPLGKAWDEDEVDADADAEGEADMEGEYLLEDGVGSHGARATNGNGNGHASRVSTVSMGMARGVPRRPYPVGLADLDSPNGRKQFISTSISHLFATTYEASDELSISALLAYLNAAMPQDKHEDFDTSEVARAVGAIVAAMSSGAGTGGGNTAGNSANGRIKGVGRLVFEGDILRVVV